MERSRKWKWLHARCAGVDISKEDAKVCGRVAGAGRGKTTETVTMWGSMTSQILALRDHLVAERVTCPVMEAAGDYWTPFYYLLEDTEFEVFELGVDVVSEVAEVFQTLMTAPPAQRARLRRR